MPHPSSTGTPRTIVTFAGALGGFAVALYNYLTPLTGVNGTAGALLVVVACLLIAIAAILIQLSRNTTWRGVLRFMVGLGGVLTAVAAYFLHEWVLMAAMGLVIIGLAFDIAQTSQTTTGVPA
ncbi:hypothetical protein P775_19035 [Puniceibacterium antarcticum]|uniref:Uncharacterized protein n=1 Tax=Puniceibacterium antarcticum TaxID=1206336 RepID=A0A2G8RC37_9RHOB|nr:hypothetical protein [Puniceibacterium antarcticum]PIL18668.1 hypothetical protein P775_19035 [Puniceibacterium antarcticum]